MSMPAILFICTGNIFRSVVAEYALKALVGPQSEYTISSAGIEADPARVDPPPPFISEHVRAKDADLSRHVQRRLTRELLERADLPVAMGLGHREFTRQCFRRDIRLFNEICYGRAEPVLDIHEAVLDWSENLEAARSHAHFVIDYIWGAMPHFLKQVASRPEIWYEAKALPPRP